MSKKIDKELLYITRIKYSILSFINDLDSKPLIKCLDKLKYLYDEKEDPRTGHETYGYKSCMNNMIYISDRWNCPFRIRWLIDGIEGGYFKKCHQ